MNRYMVIISMGNECSSVFFDKGTDAMMFYDTMLYVPGVSVEMYRYDDKMGYYRFG